MDFDKHIPGIPERLVPEAQEIGARAVEWCAEMDELDLADQRYPRIRAQLPWMTVPLVNSARENGRIGRDTQHRNLNAEEILTLYALNELPDIMARPKNSKDLNPKHVGKIIDTVLKMSEDQPTD